MMACHKTSGKAPGKRGKCGGTPHRKINSFQGLGREVTSPPNAGTSHMLPGNWMFFRPDLIYSAASDMGCRESGGRVKGRDGPCFNWRDKGQGEKGCENSSRGEEEGAMRMHLGAGDGVLHRQEAQPCHTWAELGRLASLNCP